MSLQIPPTLKPFDNNGNPDDAWVEWMLQVQRNLKYLGEYTTSGRPIDNLFDGDYIMDTTLGKPVWYYNGGWIDATGTTV